MAIKVDLRTEQGERVSSLIDRAYVLNRLLPQSQGEAERFKLLQYIDEYGDTIFNPIQARAFLSDLGQLLRSVEDAEQRTSLKEVEQLTVRCAKSTHLYLWFIGD